MPFFRSTCIFLLTVSILFVSLTGHDVNAQTDASLSALSEVKYTSMVQLIANAHRYHDAKVQVVGTVIVEEGRSAVYLALSDAKFEITKNGIWLNLTEEQLQIFAPFNRRVCRVEGIFHFNEQGPGRLWTGQLDDISILEAYQA